MAVEQHVSCVRPWNWSCGVFSGSFTFHTRSSDEEGLGVLREPCWALHNQGRTLLLCFMVNPFWEGDTGLLLEGGHGVHRAGDQMRDKNKGFSFITDSKSECPPKNLIEKIFKCLIWSVILCLEFDIKHRGSTSAWTSVMKPSFVRCTIIKNHEEMLWEEASQQCYVK